MAMDPRKLMDDWEQAAPPMPKQFLEMISQSGLFSPIQMQYIKALMKNPNAGVTPPAAGGVSQPDPGVGTANSALGPANPLSPKV